MLGTQMERHIAKRLGIGCAVISAPVHVQDFPARYSPQMGFEGANVLFDTWVHPLVMGLEEHLLGMFREDFEFNDEAVPSHLATATATPARALSRPANPRWLEPPADASGGRRRRAVAVWTADADGRAEEDPVFRARQGPRNAEVRRRTRRRR